MKLEVKITKPLRSSSTVKAGAKVRLTFEDGESLVIADLRILENRSGASWVSMPQYSIKTDQRVEYFPSVAMSRALEKKVTDAVLAAYEDQQYEQQPQPTNGMDETDQDYENSRQRSS